MPILALNVIPANEAVVKVPTWILLLLIRHSRERANLVSIGPRIGCRLGRDPRFRGDDVL